MRYLIYMAILGYETTAQILAHIWALSRRLLCHLRLHLLVEHDDCQATVVLSTAGPKESTSLSVCPNYNQLVASLMQKKVLRKWRRAIESSAVLTEAANTLRNAKRYDSVATMAIAANRNRGPRGSTQTAQVRQGTSPQALTRSNCP